MGPGEQNSFTHTNTFQEGILHIGGPHLSLFADPNSQTRKIMGPNCRCSWPKASGHLLYFSLKCVGGKISDLICAMENLKHSKHLWQVDYHWIYNSGLLDVHIQEQEMVQNGHLIATVFNI